MEFAASRHKRMKSDPATERIQDAKTAVFTAHQPPKMAMEQVKICQEPESKPYESIEVKNSLKEEIEQLQKQLEDQLIIRSQLEKATTSQPFSYDYFNEASLTKSSKDLIKEISILEFEVKHLEKYLLSLYRKTFHKKEQSLSVIETKSRSKEQQLSLVNSTSFVTARASFDNPPKDFCPILESQQLEDSNVIRSHSSLSYRTPPLFMAVNQAVESYHSLPLGMLELTKDDYSSVSLGEHLGGCISNNIRTSANWLSEEMIRCISGIYSQIADPPLIHPGFTSSPISFPSPPSGSSPRDQFSMWSPLCEGSLEFSGPYFTTLEVHGICKNTHRPSSVEHKQRTFRDQFCDFPLTTGTKRIINAYHRDQICNFFKVCTNFAYFLKPQGPILSLVSQLEQIDPRKLKHEEKLAFWINIHNALVMHVFLVHGTPRTALKRISLVLKAAYNIGGHNISVGDIQSIILGCRMPHPGQWFQLLLFPSPKYKSRDARKAYAMKQPQPLAYFALCSGSCSDPMVRIYMPKSVFQELEVAKEEYIHNNFKIQKAQKMFLPKLVDLYAKDSGLCHAELMEMIEHSVPDCYQKSFKSIKKAKSLKKIEWVAHDFAFRYLLSPDLAK